MRLTEDVFGGLRLLEKVCDPSVLEMVNVDVCVFESVSPVLERLTRRVRSSERDEEKESELEAVIVAVSVSTAVLD